MANTEAPKDSEAKQTQERRGQSKLQRFNLGLPEPAVQELARIEQLTGQGYGALMRWALVLLARYVRALEQGEEVRIVNPKDPSVQRVIELPINILRETNS